MPETKGITIALKIQCLKSFPSAIHHHSVRHEGPLFLEKHLILRYCKYISLLLVYCNFWSNRNLYVHSRFNSLCKFEQSFVSSA